MTRITELNTFILLGIRRCLIICTTRPYVYYIYGFCLVFTYICQYLLNSNCFRYIQGSFDSINEQADHTKNKFEQLIVNNQSGMNGTCVSLVL